MRDNNDLTLVDIGILLTIIAAIVVGFFSTLGIAAGSAIRLFTWACGCNI